ncbi:unnamed protein product [Polarella glacialis]|uniref:Uncharacterized protein n=1 Tax=Polarella glacialis TaxID=89957 RepID=A0A813LAZ8_POLGL|nr:unnamed protein product [Polarella glacialis]
MAVLGPLPDVTSGRFRRKDGRRWRSVPVARTARWAVEGFGHCQQSRALVLASAAAPSLRSCLRRCDAAGPLRCRFASFVDADVLVRLGGGRSQGACQLARRCPELQAVTFGAVTYRRLTGLGHSNSRASRQRDARLSLQRQKKEAEAAFGRFATLALARPFVASPAWQPQVCASDDGHSVSLQHPCTQVGGGFFQLSHASKTSQGLTLQISAASSGRKLCADGGSVHLAEAECQLGQWELVHRGWDSLSTSHRDHEACSWFRVTASGSRSIGSAGGGVEEEEEEEEESYYLAAATGPSSSLRLVPATEFNSSQLSACWALGFQQQRDAKLLRIERSDFNIGTPGAQIAEVWLMASRNYQRLLDRLLENLESAGDPVRVHVRWAQDFRDIGKQFWDIRGTSFVFNAAKLALAFEALLWTATAAGPSSGGAAPPVVLLDLDVVVFPGWAPSLRSCVEGDRAADVCAFQQPAHPFELVNSGVLVWRGGAGRGAQSLAHAALAAHHGYEAFMRLVVGGPAALEQLIWNAIFRRVWRQRTRRSVRWGVYNPTLARVGPVPSAALTLRIQHVAWWATMEEKIEAMDRITNLVTAAQQLCSTVGAGCTNRPGTTVLTSEGPLLPVCLASLQVDPHFGPPLECNKLYSTFDPEADRSCFRRLKESEPRLAGLARDFENRLEAFQISSMIQEIGEAMLSQKLH